MKKKLTSKQKENLKTLDKYLKTNNCWLEGQDLSDAIQDGGLAVLSVRGPVFNSIVCCKDIKEAQAICDFNPSAHSRVVDLSTGKVLWEEEKGWMPRKPRN